MRVTSLNFFIDFWLSPLTTPLIFFIKFVWKYYNTFEGNSADI